MIKRWGEYVWRFGPPLLWMAAIFWGSAQSSLPGGPTTFWDYVIKKAAHMIEYGILWFLWFRAFNRRREGIVWAICILFAVSDEFHQLFTPTRTPRVIDIGFDILGMALVYLRLKRWV